MTDTSPLKSIARRKVRTAIISGLLAKPANCQKCGTMPPPGIDGRSKLHGHHPDHSHPLTVEWLCTSCHRSETPSNPPRGENVRNSKLTAQDVREIRVSRDSHRKIAARYGIDQTLVSQIKLRKGWAHVE